MTFRRFLFALVRIVSSLFCFVQGNIFHTFLLQVSGVFQDHSMLNLNTSNTNCIFIEPNLLLLSYQYKNVKMRLRKYTTKERMHDQFNIQQGKDNKNLNYYQQYSNKIDILMMKTKNCQKKSAFLLKTYDILSNSSFSDIIEWHYDGIGFVINNIEKFTDKILPAYFKHSNFASFIRQLNMYGFSKKRTTKSQNYYFHQKFRKNQKDMISQIQRKMEKKTLKNINRTHQNSQAKICSQLSIQLQCKNQILKPSFHQCAEDQIFNQFNKLSIVNYSLINSQLLMVTQLIKDFNGLKDTILPQNQINQAKNILSQYIQGQFMFYNQLKQRVKTSCSNKQINFPESLARLETQQTLRQKKQTEKIIEEKEEKIKSGINKVYQKL